MAGIYQGVSEPGYQTPSGYAQPINPSTGASAGRWVPTGNPRQPYRYVANSATPSPRPAPAAPVAPAAPAASVAPAAAPVPGPVGAVPETRPAPSQAQQALQGLQSAAPRAEERVGMRPPALLRQGIGIRTFPGLEALLRMGMY